MKRGVPLSSGFIAIAVSQIPFPVSMSARRSRRPVHGQHTQSMSSRQTRTFSLNSRDTSSQEFAPTSSISTSKSDSAVCSFPHQLTKRFARNISPSSYIPFTNASFTASDSPASNVNRTLAPIQRQSQPSQLQKILSPVLILPLPYCLYKGLPAHVLSPHVALLGQFLFHDCLGCYPSVIASRQEAALPFPAFSATSPMHPRQIPSWHDPRAGIQ